MTPLLRFSSISKSFYGVKVLDDVTIDVPAGRTMGLVGENGAGKSTLMNILGGNLRADRGSMQWSGSPYAPANPNDATRTGIAFVHQELNLFPNLTIAENLFLGAYPRRHAWFPFIDRGRLRERARELLRDVGLEREPDTLVDRLSPGERQLVEIAKALGRDARLIILDEPTTSLTSVETGRLFELLARLRARGITLIYISHGLGDVLRLCDDVVVLRDGAVVGHAPARELTVEGIVTWMVGRQMTQLFPPRENRPRDTVVLEVAGISRTGVVRDVGFRIRHGEILGLCGLMGAGRSELARILFGLDPCTRGTVSLEGRPLDGLTPRERIARGMAFLSEDRRGDGLSTDASIADNLTLVALRNLTRGPVRWLDAARIREAVERMREAVRLTPAARDEQPVRTLSGGNQQKVVFAKWLPNHPKVFLLDEPTRGIDVGAKYEVYRLVGELAARGAGILLISSEVEELMGLCDRILVMRRGEIRDCLDRSEFDRERLLRTALHAEATA
ncbi:MAG: sugar ABC transporter ATP-binding protein [Verrucomicrobiales bacterium]|nr:sugar ABC transporter ATP-binding protein [Verrucomicrobiales bacterium]